MLIDVGQLARDPMAADPEVYKQSLFNKSYRLRFWLKERAPELQSYLEARLVEVIGAQFEFMQPDADV